MHVCNLKGFVSIMDAPNQCKRAVVHFLTAENVTASEIYRRILSVYCAGVCHADRYYCINSDVIML